MRVKLNRTCTHMSVGLVLAAAGCAINPATGQRELSFVSESQEIQIGRESDPAITAQMGGLYPDSALQRYVRGLGLQISASSERPALPWSFKLLDDELVNAFALPGGFVYVTRGILGYMNSEAELVGVLGHEAGHVTARHTAGQITRMQLGQIGLGVGMIFSETVRQYGQAAATGMQLLFLKYSRDDESQADMLGFRYMTGLTYNPDGLTSVMRMLQSTSPSAEGSVPNWLSSHPDPGNRVQANEQRITAAATDFSSYATNRDQFLQRLDGMTFGPDPRQGYFLAQRFLHPTLEFEITFPAGWATANGSQSVQAGAPDRDALMALTFATAATAAAAANELRAMQGLTVRRSFRESVKGLNAEFIEFDAQTQDGVLSGTIMYVEYGGAVYEVAAYAVQAKWVNYRTVADAALRSFGRLTGATYLDVEPHRVDIVRLPRAMTFAEFAQQYPSSVDINEVLLANQVQQNERLPAGRLMKRITGGRVPAR